MKLAARRFLLLMVCLAFVICSSDAPVLAETSIYALSAEHVWRISPGRVELMDASNMRSISEFIFDGDCRAAAAHGKRLYMYCIDGDTHYISRYNDGFSSDGKWELPPELYVLQIAASEETVIILANEYSGDAYLAENTLIRGEVYVLELSSGDCKKVDGLANISCIAVTDEYIGAYSETEGTLELVRQADHDITAVCMAENIESFAISDAKCVYVLTNDYVTHEIVEIQPESNARRVLYQTDSELSGLHFHNGCVYTIDTEMAEPVAVSADDAECTVLTVGCFLYMPDDLNVNLAINEFKNDHPDIEIEYIVYDNESVMYTEMMSRESDVDVYFLQDAGLVNPNAMFNGGALMDLSESSVVTEAFNGLIDLDGVTMYNGALIGVPRNMWVHLFEVNLPLFEELGLQVPENGWTWNDFFELGKQVSKIRDDGYDVFLLYDDVCPALPEQFYINAVYNGSIDCFDEEFRNAMLSWKEFVDLGLIVPYSDELPFRPENALLRYTYTPHANYAYVAGEYGNGYVMVPKLNDDSGTVVTVLSVCVSSTTDIPELACEFAANFIKEPVISHGLSIGTLGDIRKEPGQSYEPVEFFDYAAPEDELVWREFLSDGVMRWECGELFVYSAYELYELYMNGEISIDEYCFRAQEKADMILGE